MLLSSRTGQPSFDPRLMAWLATRSVVPKDMPGCPEGYAPVDLKQSPLVIAH
jgi:hypothetical protein